VRIPGKTKNIGWYKLGNKAPCQASRSLEKRCLFIGSGLHTEQSITAFNRLRVRYNDVHFYYRPHPIEKHKVSSFLDISLIDCLPLYESLCLSSHVIGDMSTVLFEANECGCKVLGLRSEYLIGTGLDLIIEFCDIDDFSLASFFLD
jgi:hypothetical protein